MESDGWEEINKTYGKKEMIIGKKMGNNGVNLRNKGIKEEERDHLFKVCLWQEITFHRVWG